MWTSKSEARRAAVSSLAAHELRRSSDPEWHCRSRVIYDGKGSQGRGLGVSSKTSKACEGGGAGGDDAGGLVFSADFEGGWSLSFECLCDVCAAPVLEESFNGE